MKEKEKKKMGFSLNVKDYTKEKQRIIFFILYALAGLILLFSIIGLATGSKGAARFFSKTILKALNKIISNCLFTFSFYMYSGTVLLDICCV